jgi:tetratricopeptide (TPR) repeat protein
MDRFIHIGKLDDLERAIAVNERAVHLTPEGHADKSRCLMNLGTSFQGLFKRTRDSNYIDKAISAHEHAVCLVADGHVDKPVILSHLGESFLLRFNHTGTLADIDNSILAHENAVRLSPEDHVNTSQRLLGLGSSFNRRFQHSGNRRDFDMAVSKFRLSASISTGIPGVRFNAAVSWARLAFTDGALTSLQGYDTALNILPRCARLGQTISTRHYVLSSASGIVNEAAAAAIESGKHERALEWLEQGRSVIWSQLLNLRTPVDKLRNADCELADDLVRISKLLECASARGNSPTDRSLSMEQAA